MTAVAPPHTCASPVPRPHPTAGICRRELLVAAGAVLMSGCAADGEVPAQAFLFDHKWTFETEPDMPGEEFTTRFGVVQFGPPSSRRPPPLELAGGAGWQTCSDPAGLARTSHVLFLAGLGSDRAKSREAIVCPSDGFVVDLRPAGQTDAAKGRHGGPEHIAVSDFIRAYVQQVVAFDLEDARVALAGRTPSQLAASVAAGEKSAMTAALGAARQVRGAGQASPPQGQLLLLTFGSPDGCLRQSKEAFNACRAGLPAGAVSMQAVGIDARLPPGTVRATVFASHS